MSTQHEKLDAIAAMLRSMKPGPMILQEARADQRKISTPEDCARILAPWARAAQEHFFALPLDTKNRFLGIDPEPVTVGIADATLVHPREIFRGAIVKNGAAIVLAHNHPSGDPAPSAADIRVTRQLIEAGRVMDIRILDHVILGASEQGICPRFVSLREEGICEFS